MFRLAAVEVMAEEVCKLSIADVHAHAQLWITQLMKTIEVGIDWTRLGL